jgi:hypothetical protein
MGAPNDPRGRGITVTIKYGKGYDDTWAVFHGTVEDVRADLTMFFGLPSTSDTSLTLSELVVNATGIAHGLGALAGELGAVVIAAEHNGAAPPSQGQAAGPDPWTQANTMLAAPAATAPTVPQPHPLLALIEQAPTVRALELLWVENQDAFADPAVMAAWKARGRVLNSAT